MSVRVCWACGKAVADGHLSCPECGAGADLPREARVVITGVDIPFRRLLDLAFKATLAWLLAAVGVGAILGLFYLYLGYLGAR